MKFINLSKKFNEHFVFRQLTFEFEKGNIYSIFGKNAAGKTTLLNILNGNLSYDEGVIEDNAFSILLENNDFPFEHMTADEFIEVTFKFKQVTWSQEEKRELYAQLDFDPQEKIIKEFSKGMKSKLYLIISLLSHPKILLLDEPFSDIDILSFKSIIKILKLKKEEMIIIFSTHQAKIAFELSDKILYLSESSLLLFENNFKNIEELEFVILQKMDNK
ncbi:MAG: ATP-binding cassette domain-containing protein [Lactovum sp.]